MPLARPSALLSQSMPRLGAVSERIGVVVMLDSLSDGAETVASVPVVRNWCVLGVALLNAQ